MLTRIYDEVDSEIPYDIILYTDEEFKELSEQLSAFQNRISQKGRGALWGGNRSRMHNGNDSRRYYDWLEHSSQDLIAAKILSEDDRCYRLSAFHCQQAIEKALESIYPAQVGCTGGRLQPDLALPAGKEVRQGLSPVV